MTDIEFDLVVAVVHWMGGWVAVKSHFFVELLLSWGCDNIEIFTDSHSNLRIHFMRYNKRLFCKPNNNKT